MMQKPRDRRLSDRDLFLLKSVLECGQRDVRLLRYQLPHQILVRRQREIFVAAEFGRVDAARLPVKLEEADDRTDADPALLRSFRDGGPALDRPDHSPTQIRRIWLRHACRPPPSRQLESYSRRYGNPRFSLSGKRSSRAEPAPQTIATSRENSMLNPKIRLNGTIKLIVASSMNWFGFSAMTAIAMNHGIHMLAARRTRKPFLIALANTVVSFSAQNASSPP